MPTRHLVLAGVAVAFVTGVLLRLDPNYLTAVATAVLATFAAVQIWTEWRRRRDGELSLAHVLAEEVAHDLETIESHVRALATQPCGSAVGFA